ncbi:MAG TPA: DUF2147 domain-containing protein [Polyangiaceae bacterium]|nr:DUF2147 domain-containing protein [Polyangiaceae bacterium]
MKLAVPALVTAFLVAPLSNAHPVAQPGASASEHAEPLDTTYPADSILGEWWSEGKEGRLKIVKTKSGLYEVVIVDGKDADNKDVKNPDPKLREQKLRGKVIMWHLRFEDGEYIDGYCYNPRDGNTYRVKMKITGPASLRLRGYLAIPLLGQNQDWTRAT